jgi:hypothetical protein
VSVQGVRVAPGVCSAAFAATLASAWLTSAPHSVLLAPLCGWLLFATQLAGQAAASNPPGTA